MNVLITGGAGFIGRYLSNLYIKKGFNVFNLDLIPNSDKKITNLLGNILDKDFLNKIFVDYQFDIIIHSCAKVPISNLRFTFDEINIEGTKNILNKFTDSRIKKFVYISSSAVYGIPDTIPISEQHERRPVESYGLSKKIGEDLCLKLIQDYNVNIIRPRTVIGGNRLGIFSILFDWIDSNIDVPVLNNGDNKYQFVDVNDLTFSIYLASLNKYSGSLNIGAEKFLSIRQLLEILIKNKKSKSVLKNIDNSFLYKFSKIISKTNILPLKDYHYLAYGKDIYFDISFSKKILDWTPKFSNTESINISYDNFINVKTHSIKNTSTHQSPLKSKILKYLPYLV